MANALFFLGFMTISGPAWAYLDPGTGSIILQGLIAGFAVAALTIRTYWFKIRRLFGKGHPTSLADEEEIKPTGEEKSAD